MAGSGLGLHLSDACWVDHRTFLVGCSLFSTTHVHANKTWQPIVLDALQHSMEDVSQSHTQGQQIIFMLKANYLLCWCGYEDYNLLYEFLVVFGHLSINTKVNLYLNRIKLPFVSICIMFIYTG